MTLLDRGKISAHYIPPFFLILCIIISRHSLPHPHFIIEIVSCQNGRLHLFNLLAQLGRHISLTHVVLLKILLGIRSVSYQSGVAVIISIVAVSIVVRTLSLGCSVGIVTKATLVLFVIVDSIVDDGLLLRISRLFSLIFFICIT